VVKDFSPFLSDEEQGDDEMPPFKRIAVASVKMSGDDARRNGERSGDPGCCWTIPVPVPVLPSTRAARRHSLPHRRSGGSPPSSSVAAAVVRLPPAAAAKKKKRMRFGSVTLSRCTLKLQSPAMNGIPGRSSTLMPPPAPVFRNGA
jgi:hypothetical protein